MNFISKREIYALISPLFPSFCLFVFPSFCFFLTFFSSYFLSVFHVFHLSFFFTFVFSFFFFFLFFFVVTFLVQIEERWIIEKNQMLWYTQTELMIFLCRYRPYFVSNYFVCFSFFSLLLSFAFIDPLFVSSTRLSWLS